jgi:hypothetical protein
MQHDVRIVLGRKMVCVWMIGAEEFRMLNGRSRVGERDRSVFFSETEQSRKYVGAGGRY